MNLNLTKDLKELLDNEVINKDTAQKISDYYNSKSESQPNRLFIAFGILGATLLGLGIILVLAHNWDEFSKSIKSIIAFIPLLIGQGIAGYTLYKNKSVVWRESSGVFLFFAVGASIALISQIYHIPGDFATYMMTWVVLCLPLVYLLKSNAVALLTLIFATTYACTKGYDFGSQWAFPYLYLVYLLLLMPYYIIQLKAKQKSNWVTFFNWFLPLSLTIVLGTFTQQLSPLAYIFMFGLFYNLGKLPVFSQDKLRTNGFLIFGSFGTIVVLLIMTFNLMWQEIIYSIINLKIESIMATVVLFLSALAVLIINLKHQERFKFNVFQYVFIGFLLIYGVGMYQPFTATVLTNILLLALGINAVKIGANTNHLGVLNYGMLIITAMIVSRFFDENISFAIKGMLFILIGIGFFAVNYFMLKHRNKILK